MPLHPLSKFEWLAVMYLWPWRREVSPKTGISRGLNLRRQKQRLRKTGYWDFENNGRDITFDPGDFVEMAHFDALTRRVAQR